MSYGPWAGDWTVHGEGMDGVVANGDGEVIEPETLPDGTYYTSLPVIALWRRQGRFQRCWRRGRITSSLLIRKGLLIKWLHRFDPKHTATPEGLASMLAECAAAGVDGMPSSYGDIYARLAPMPFLKPSVNNVFGRYFRAGWQAALQQGAWEETHRLYDLSSAYLWASTMGLPDWRDFRVVRKMQDSRPGVYLAEIRPHRDLPFPFDRNRVVLLSSEELDTVPVDVVRVRGGVCWERVGPPDEVLSIVKRFSFWKEIGRSYWGTWCAGPGQVFQDTHTGSFPVPPRGQNIVWAHLIASRVRLRLWEMVSKWGDAVKHVFVDSVLISGAEVETSDDIGGWRLVRTYTDGVRVDGTGHYGPREGPPDKWAGQPKSRRAER